MPLASPTFGPPLFPPPPPLFWMQFRWREGRPPKPPSCRRRLCRLSKSRQGRQRGVLAIGVDGYFARLKQVRGDRGGLSLCRQITHCCFYGRGVGVRFAAFLLFSATSGPVLAGSLVRRGRAAAAGGCSATFTGMFQDPDLLLAPSPPPWRAQISPTRMERRTFSPSATLDHSPEPRRAPPIPAGWIGIAGVCWQLPARPRLCHRAWPAIPGSLRQAGKHKRVWGHGGAPDRTPYRCPPPPPPPVHGHPIAREATHLIGIGRNRRPGAGIGFHGRNWPACLGRRRRTQGR